MRWSELTSRLPAAQCEFMGPVTEHELAQAEAALGTTLPGVLRAFLVEVGPCALMYHSTPDAGGLHILPPGGMTGLVQQTEWKREGYGKHMNGLTVFGHTPGAGAFYLAMDRRGRVIDLFGQPDQAPASPGPFGVYRGEWRIIANSLEDLVTRMLQEAESAPDPFYWFRA